MLHGRALGDHVDQCLVSRVPPLLESPSTFAFPASNSRILVCGLLLGLICLQWWSAGVTSGLDCHRWGYGWTQDVPYLYSAVDYLMNDSASYVTTFPFLFAPALMTPLLMNSPIGDVIVSTTGQLLCTSSTSPSFQSSLILQQAKLSE